MGESSTDRCGYIWPENYEVIDDPGRLDCGQENCCCRETLSDTNCCAWHADPGDTDEKTAQTLRDARVDADTREQIDSDDSHSGFFHVVELLDGAILRGLELGEGFSLARVALRGADLTGAYLFRSDLTDAILEDADLSDAYLGSAGLPGAYLREADLTDAILEYADLPGADLREADLTNAILQRADLPGADLRKADLTDAGLRSADLTDAGLRSADLTDADLREADLTGADLRGTDLTNAILRTADLTGADLREADLTGADLRRADLPDADLREADLTGADLREADLTGADLRRADLTDADLGDANLTDTDLEQATLIGTELFDTDLTETRLYGARITDVQINRGTDLHTDRSEYASWWQRGLLTPAPRCGYDLALREDANGENMDREELLSKAASTYNQFEELAHNNTQPSLESSMFVRRQEMQRKLHRTRGEPFQYAFAVVSGTVFNYGESLARVFMWGLLIIVAYAAVYSQFDLIQNGADGFIESPVDTLYFSTLTFTTLGLGDFQPDPASELARVLVTSQAALGAILIAIFVFVLGRRAAR